MALDEKIKQLEERVQQRTEFLQKVVDLVSESTRLFGYNGGERVSHGSYVNVVRRLDINNFRFEQRDVYMTIRLHDLKHRQCGEGKIVLQVMVFGNNDFQVETYNLDATLENELLQMAESQAFLFEELQKRQQTQQEQDKELSRKQKRFGELLVEAERVKVKA